MQCKTVIKRNFPGDLPKRVKRVLARSRRDHIPGQPDLDGVAVGIVRLHDYYQFNTTSRKWSRHGDFVLPEYFAGSVTFNENEWWLLGQGGSGLDNSTWIIRDGSLSRGPEMPIPASFLCAAMMSVGVIWFDILECRIQDFIKRNLFIWVRDPCILKYRPRQVPPGRGQEPLRRGRRRPAGRA